MLPGWLLVVVGVVVLGLGLAGVSGALARSRFSLYEDADPERSSPPSTHRRMQRVGGGMALVVGAWFIWSGVSGG